MNGISSWVLFRRYSRDFHAPIRRRMRTLKCYSRTLKRSISTASVLWIRHAPVPQTTEPKYRNMLHFTRLALLPVCAFSLALASCEEETAVDDTTAPITRDDWTAPGVDRTGAPADPTVNQEVSDFRDRMAEELDELDRELALIDERADNLRDDVRDRYEDALVELRDRRDNLEERIQQIEVDSRARWVEMRTEIEAAWTQLTDNIVEVRRELDENPN